MNTLDTILTRRSTRNYLPKLVEKDKLDKILLAGQFAPCGSNTQTNHFFVVQKADILQKLISLVESRFATMEVTEGMYSSIKNSIERSKKGGYIFTYNASTLIIVANKKDYGNNMADCATAVENMMITANALDLGSCWINQLRWLNEDPIILDYLHPLGLTDDERVYASLIVGYPATKDGLPIRTMPARKGNEITYLL